MMAFVTKWFTKAKDDAINKWNKTTEEAGKIFTDPNERQQVKESLLNTAKKGLDDTVRVGKDAGTYITDSNKRKQLGDTIANTAKTGVDNVFEFGKKKGEDVVAEGKKLITDPNERQRVANDVNNTVNTGWDYSKTIVTDSDARERVKNEIEDRIKQEGKNFIASKEVIPCFIKSQPLFQDITESKQKIREQVTNSLKPYCKKDEYTKYIGLKKNATLWPYVKTYAESVLNDPKQQGTFPDLTSLKVDKLCKKENKDDVLDDVLKYIKNKNDQDAFKGACNIVKNPTIETICKNRTSIDSYLEQKEFDAFHAACEIYENKNATTICKEYNYVTSYLPGGEDYQNLTSDLKKQLATKMGMDQSDLISQSKTLKEELPSLCEFYNVDHNYKVDWICNNQQSVMSVMNTNQTALNVGTSEKLTEKELAAACAVHDNPTSKTLCMQDPTSIPHLSDEQKKQLQTLCKIRNAEDKVTTICNNKEALLQSPFTDYVPKLEDMKYELLAACALHDDPTHETLCRVYHEIEEIPEDDKKNIKTLCEYVNDKNKVDWICHHREEPGLNSFLTKGQRDQLKLTCALYDSWLTGFIVDGQCEDMYAEEFGRKCADCCNEYLEKKTVPLIDAQIQKRVQTYTKVANRKLEDQVPKIDAGIKKNVTHYTNLLNDDLNKKLPMIDAEIENKINEYTVLVNDKLDRDLSTQMDTILRGKIMEKREGIVKKVTQTVGPMADELKDGLEQADTAVGKCFSHTHYDGLQLNRMCYLLQHDFDSPVCHSDKGCCLDLLDNVCS